MRAVNLGAILALAAVMLMTTAVECDSPVLSRLDANAKPKTTPLGEHTDSAEFKDLLAIGLKKTDTVTLVVVRDGGANPSEAFRNGLQASAGSDLYFQNNVKQALATVSGFLDQKSIKFEQVSVSKVDEAFTL